jgi:CIC family chloride channel protein
MFRAGRHQIKRGRERAAEASRRLAELTAPPIRWITRLRLLLLGQEELKGLMLWAALVGVLGALSSVVFREGIRLFQWMLTGEYGSLVQTAADLPWWHRALIPTIGGVAAGLVLHSGARLLGNRRAVDYMEAVVVGDGAIAARPTLLRSLSSLLTIGSGGSIGREGPMVQLAALIGSKLGVASRAPIPRRRLLVACGAAAGIASAYNAPIAGALFVAEIVMGSIAVESFGPLLVASVTASVTVHRFLGLDPVYAVPHVSFGSNWELIVYALLGIVAGHLAPPFLGAIEWTKERFSRIDLPAYVKMGIGGAVVGTVSIAVPQVWGNGYSVVGSILSGELAGALLIAILAAKFVATTSTVGSGAVGGLFTPTLFVGAATGALVADALHWALPGVESSSGAYALVGMGAFLAATTHAPLTSILMIFEMTLDYDVVLPLMLACVAAHYTAHFYRGGRSVYHESLKSQSADAAGRVVSVAELVRPAVATTTGDRSLRSLLESLPTRPVESVFVLAPDGRLVGSISPRIVMRRVAEGVQDPDVPVERAAAVVSSFLTPQMSLSAALEVFVREQASVLPVVSGAWHPVLIGQVARHDLALAVQDQLSSRAV